MRLIAFFITFFITFSVFGQNTKIDKAKNLILTGKTTKAISLLKKLYIKSSDLAAAKELVLIYSNQNDFVNAVEWVKKSELDKSNSSNDVILYAKLLVKTTAYQQALNHCLKFALENEESSEVYKMAYAVEELILAQKKSVLFTLDTVPFNTIYDEISIANYRKNFIMSSNGVYDLVEDKIIYTPYFDFYMLQQDYGKWRYPSPLLKSVDHSYNKTTLCYSKDGNEIFYTRSVQILSTDRKTKIQPLPKFNILHAFSLGNQWLQDTLLPFQDNTFSYKDPALHPNGNLLVFSSNRNGEGHYDLYYTIRTNDQWSAPKSLGNLVNSTFDERMPYFKEDGTLYFCSDHENGFGGYDLYSTHLEGNIWIQPEILPPPINSIYDDLSIVFNNERSGGFFVSNRPESLGGYNIFSFKEFDFQLSINILDDETGGLLDYVEVQLYEDDIQIDEKLTDDKGVVNFQAGASLNYTIKVQKEGYLSVTRDITSVGKLNGEIHYENIRLKKEPKIVISDESISAPINNKNVIDFTARIENNQNVELINHPVKIINLTEGKIKNLITNEIGEIKQFLFVGNKYKFIVEYDNENIENEFSTIDLDPASKIKIVFTLKGIKDLIIQGAE